MNLRTRRADDRFEHIDGSNSNYAESLMPVDVLKMNRQNSPEEKQFFLSLSLMEYASSNLVS